MKKAKEKYSVGSTVLTIFFTLLSLVWVIPIFEVVNNSFKSNNYVNLDPFALPNSESFMGFENSRIRATEATVMNREYPADFMKG